MGGLTKARIINYVITYCSFTQYQLTKLEIMAVVNIQMQ